jgi:hypothetical protein
LANVEPIVDLKVYSQIQTQTQLKLMKLSYPLAYKSISVSAEYFGCMLIVHVNEKCIAFVEGCTANILCSDMQDLCMIQSIYKGIYSFQSSLMQNSCGKTNFITINSHMAPNF